MYINQIDTLLSNILDDFYSYIKSHKLTTDLLTDLNFTKYQKEINILLDTYIKTINLSTLQESIKNKDNLQYIMNVFNKYISHYLYLYVGSLYSGKQEKFITNIINYLNTSNSYTNSFIINNFILVKQIKHILKSNTEERKKLKENVVYTNSINFLNNLGRELVISSFDIENIELQSHNIIKTILYIEQYKKIEKKEIFQILETNSGSNEYRYIDIVVNREDSQDKNQDNQNNKEIKKVLSVDDKIIYLLKTRILIPIVDDFLLYNKDTEKYESKSSLDLAEKKKESTKIKYIVNKIDKASENTNSRDKSIWYSTLLDRKGILINHLEDLKILDKVNTIKKMSTEQNEFINDFNTYKEYPYINFKNLSNPGFGILLENMDDLTLDAVRFVSFEKEPFINPKNARLQLRVASENQIVNIVGFLINQTKQIDKLKVGDVKIINEIIDENTITDILSNNIKNPIAWIFSGKDKIKVDEYSHNTNNTDQDNIKQIISTLYDKVVESLFDVITNKKSKYLSEAFNLIDKYKDDYHLDININPIIENIYLDCLKVKEEYDIKDDIIHGVDKNMVKLPTYKPNINNKDTTINIYKKNKNIIKLDKQDINTLDKLVCQHYITWDYITKLQKSNINRFSDLLFQFIQQYVKTNDNMDYVCKSCGEYLNIHRYMDDGIFNDETRQYIPYSNIIDIPLEQIPEYEKYKLGVKLLDKLVDKMVSISGITTYSGDNMQNKMKRRHIVKSTIDTIIENNKLLNKSRKTKYGVNKDLSNMFIFEFDNNIFVFSNKEKEHYKHIKFNNVLCYILVCLVTDFSESSLNYMIGDKICNYNNFIKFGLDSLFSGLSIISSHNQFIEPVKVYPVLCYILYIISCDLTKYNIWFSLTDINLESNKIKFNPITQKSIIHTFIDILNSILEKPDDFKIISSIFFNKLKFFKNISFLDRFKDKVKKMNTFVKSGLQSQNVTLHGYYIKSSFDKSRYNPVPNSKYYTEIYNKPVKTNIIINNNTNCSDGKFHEWKVNKNILECKLCKEQVNKTNNNKNQEKLHYLILEKMAKIKCIKDGDTHIFKQEQDQAYEDSICIKCKNTVDHKYTEKDLDKLEDVVNSFKKNTSIIKQDKLETENKLETKNKLETDINIINTFIKNLQNIIGLSVNLTNDTYIIDHDHTGVFIKTPIIIKDNDNKIVYQTNHSFFKKDVYYYINNISGRLEVYYDAITLLLIGYKYNQNEIVTVHSTRKLKINYCFKNKIKLLGFESRVYYIEKTDQLFNTLSKEDIINNNLKDIIRQRIKNIKGIINNVQTTLYKIKNKYNIVEEEKISIEYINKYKNQDKQKLLEKQEKQENQDSYNNLIKEYIPKFNDIELNNFKNWKNIVDNVYIDDNTYNITSPIINSFEISKYDKSGNSLLFYLISEFNDLLMSNKNQTMQQNIGEFYIKYINILFYMFNTDDLYNDISILKYIYAVTSTYIYDTTNEDYTTQLYNYEEELKEEQKEEKKNLDSNIFDSDSESDSDIDFKEEKDALDIDIDAEDSDYANELLEGFGNSEE